MHKSMCILHIYTCKLWTYVQYKYTRVASSLTGVGRCEHAVKHCCAEVLFVDVIAVLLENLIKSRCRSCRKAAEKKQKSNRKHKKSSRKATEKHQKLQKTVEKQQGSRKASENRKLTPKNAAKIGSANHRFSSVICMQIWWRKCASEQVD